MMITPLHERISRAAGTLCGGARSDDVVDASVVVLAQMLEGSVITGDADDLRRLAEAGGYAMDQDYPRDSGDTTWGAGGGHLGQ